MINFILKTFGLRTIIHLMTGAINKYEDIFLQKIPDKNVRKIIDDFTDLLDDLDKII